VRCAAVDKAIAQIADSICSVIIVDKLKKSIIMIKGPGRDLDMGDSVRWVFTCVTLLVGLLASFITTCLIMSVV